MPARDPAVHSPPPLQQQPHFPGYSPTSSAFSTRTTTISSSPTPGSEGYVANLLRRVSGDRSAGVAIGMGHPMGSSSGSASASATDGHHHPGATAPRRKASTDLDERMTSPSLSTSSQAIRDSTNRLASLSFTSRPRAISSASSTFDNASGVSLRPGFSPSASKTGDMNRPLHPSHLSETATATIEEESPPKRLSSSLDDDISPGSSSKSPTAQAGGAFKGRSGLSMMMAREDERRRASLSDSPSSKERLSDLNVEATPVARQLRLDSASSVGLGISGYGSGDVTPKADAPSFMDDDADDVTPSDDELHSSSALRRVLAEGGAGDLEAREDTPLLGSAGGGDGKRSSTWQSVRRRVSKVSAKDIAQEILVEPVKTLPSAILGTLLNVLDGVSYGMILFPANPIFEDFGSLGVSMFFMSCIVSQLVFSCGGSIFPGGNGSMMIEAVPFFHILTNIIQAEIGDDAKAVVATTMAAFAFSSILTGLVFFTLGAFKLGTLIGYFPRHILVGCIGGVGIFLIETGLEVSLGLKSEGFEYNLSTLKLFFHDIHSVLLWTIPLFLAILLRVITHFFHHQLIFPAYFFVIPLIFYIVVLSARIDFDHLRATGWVFDVGKNTQAWWKFYTLYDFRAMSWTAFWAAMPTQLALVFFGILHVPLNVPALGVSLGEDNVKLDRELVAHGFSNFAAGLTGTVPNYLTYVNTVLFYRVGGGSRLSGLMLTVMTAIIMFIGPTVIAYLPVMVVGALIFVLGLDLAVEAVWDTRNRVNRMEYITIWAIAIGMTVWDFVIGLLFGIILACVFFVVQSSRRRAIRTVFNGSSAKSTVRRPKSQRAFIQKVGSQTYVMKLQGFLFFGTISAVEDEIRKLLDLAKWQHNPIRFLIIDFALVHGLDFSSAEAFVRVQRLLTAKDVLLIMCGAAPEGLVGTALRSVNLWADQSDMRVEVFAGLNDALEWTENAYLTAFYANQKEEVSDSGRPIDYPKVAKPPFSLAESFQNSPRRSHLAKAGDDHLPNVLYRPRPVSPQSSDVALRQPASHPQPLPILLQTFQDYLDAPADPTPFFAQLATYFTQLEVPSQHTLWTQGDQADGMYLIESGSLRATYLFDDYLEKVEETMVAGTIAGDLSTLSETKRNATVVSERECVLWKLDRDGLKKLEEEKPEIARSFVKIVLKAVAEEQEVLHSHLIAVLS